MKVTDAAPNAVADQRFAEAKAKANGDVRGAARQLEAVFVGMLFDEMAKTVDKENALFGESPGSDMYESWFRHEVASQWSRAGGTGLGDAIAGSLESRGVTVPAAATPSVRGANAVSERAILRPSSGTAHLPVAGRITSDYGKRTHPVSHVEHFHAGIDIAAKVGTPIEVPYSGRVVKVGHDGPMGHHVVVEHANGFRSVYAHASEIGVQEGQPVRSGEVLGRTGASGRATGPHLHFTLLKDGKPVDPMRWLKPRPMVSVR